MDRSWLMYEQFGGTASAQGPAGERSASSRTSAVWPPATSASPRTTLPPSRATLRLEESAGLVQAGPFVAAGLVTIWSPEIRWKNWPRS